MKALLLSIIAFAPSVMTNAQSLVGDWNGKISLGQNSLPLVLHISSQNGGNKCLLDSPDQGAKGISTILDFLGPDSIALNIPSIGAAYHGKLAGGEIKGTFSQAGMKFSLNLKPGDFVRERKQTPKGPLPYPTEEVTFENPLDHAKLAGTLSYPMTLGTQQKVPVVLLVTGSGPQNRDEELMGHKPFAVIADFLAKMGIASLRYDDRGFAKSGGNLAKATSHTFMKDALAGIDYLKSTGNFSKIGILGHSEGGMIAYMAASEKPKDIDFIVSLAGPAVSGENVVMKQNELMMSTDPRTASLSADYCKVLEKVLQHLIAGKPVTDPKAIVAKYNEEAGSKLPEVLLTNLQAILQASNPWLSYFLGYDPTQAISKTTCPVMAVQGERDTQVETKMNLEALKKKLPANKQHLIKTYPELNHLFQHSVTGLMTEYATIDETISMEALTDIAKWINGLK